MRKLATATALGLCAALVASSAAAGVLVSSHESERGQAANFTRMVWHLNGFVEFTMEPPAWFTPPSFGFERAPRKTVQAFARENQDILDIQQSLVDILFVEENEVSPGVHQLRYRQTYRGYDVETSNLTFTVTGDVVTAVAGRFVSEVHRLADCVPNLDSLEQLTLSSQANDDEEPVITFGKPFYGPFGRQTSFGVIITMDGSNDEVVKTVDACTGEILDGWTVRKLE